MHDSLYRPGAYAGLGEAAVRQAVELDGWSPLLVTDRPGALYPPHAHPEAKLLAFLRGAMEVRVGTETFRCVAGDRLEIPGETDHAAVAGPDGCDYLWSEQIRP
jgi:hypothetical protein